MRPHQVGLDAQCLTVFAARWTQIEAYGCSQIGEPLLESLKYLTPMGYDALTFVILDRLSMTRSKKLKEDGINLADWLCNLSELAGQVCKRFPDVEMTALCQVCQPPPCRRPFVRAVCTPTAHAA